MPVSYLDRLLDERTSLTGVMSGLRDRAAAEERDLADSERSEVARLQERCVEIDGLLSEHASQAESARAFASLASRIEANREDAAAETRNPSRREDTSVSAGRLVIESRAFADYRGRGRMEAVEVADFLPFTAEGRAPITTATLAIPPFVWANPAPAFRAALTNVVNTVRVSSGSVEWVESGPDPVAAVVPEATPKPEATIVFTPKTASLDTIAHWVQITRQALADASYMRSLIEGKLRNGLARKVEADLATLLNAATLQAATAANLTAAIRNGIAMVEAAGYQPNAVALNPADYADLDIAASVVGSGTGPDRRNSYWGLTPVSVPALTAGTAIVGDFTEGVTLFDRGVSDVFVTDSHADLFISNILVILAEGRYKSAITDPLALAEATATP